MPLQKPLSVVQRVNDGAITGIVSAEKMRGNDRSWLSGTTRSARVLMKPPDHEDQSKAEDRLAGLRLFKRYCGWACEQEERLRAVIAADTALPSICLRDRSSAAR